MKNYRTVVINLVFFVFLGLIKPVCMEVMKRDLSCDNKVADIIFLLDTSSSIWEEDFDKQLVFVEHIVNHLPVGEHGVHVAVASFGSDVFTHFHLNSYYDRNNLLDAISSVQYHGGGTNTGSAIKHARKMFNEKHGGRDDVEQIVIIVTDGYSSDSFETAHEASMSRSLGIRLISVGVGHGVDEFELKHIASIHNDKKMVFTVDNFDSLYNVEDVITTTTCDVIQTSNIMSDGIIENPTESQVRKYCGGKPAEVYFVVDSSSSIRSADYRKMLHFISGVIDLFDLGPHKTRVGVVTFSDGIHPVIKLDNEFDGHTLKQRIKAIKHYKGGTQTGSSLQYIREQGLKRGYARGNVAHVVILLTDGMSTDAKRTLKESQILKQMGTEIFAVGIGDQVDTYELQTISSQPRDNYVFLMQDYHVLSAIKNLLAIKTCLGTTHTYPVNDQGSETGPQADEDHVVCVPNGPVDIIYVYDRQSVGDEHSSVIENFIADILISTAGSDVHTGLITRACTSTNGVPIAAYKNWSEIKPLLRHSQTEGLSAILRGVRLTGFSKQNGGRSQAKKKVVMFIDGEIKDEHLKMQLAVKRLKFRSGVELNVVYIGKLVNKVVTSLVDGSVTEHLLQTPSIHKLHTVNQRLVEKLCNT